MKESILKDKSYNFALKIVKLSQSLQDEQKELILSKQILRSGTSIGALVREAQFGQSRADFVNKMCIALKEANETDYWLSLLKDSNHINSKLVESLQADCNELIAMLIATIKTVKSQKLKV